MDKIRINNLQFYTYNGVLEEEKRNGQKLEIDIELQVPLESAGASDDVGQTVNYAEVNDLVAGVVNGHSFDLIEAVAYQILQVLKENYEGQVKKALVRIRKYSVPMPGLYDNVEIEMEREF